MITADSFERRESQREGGEVLTFALTDEARDLVLACQTAVYGEAFFPIDSLYELVRCAVADWREAEEYGSLDEDWAHMFADSAVGVYNSDRVAWLSEVPLRRGPLCDEFADEFGLEGSASLFEKIAQGQYGEALRVAEIVAATLGGSE